MSENVAGSGVLIDFLRNRCPTWIYTTALSPADTAVAIASVEIIRSESSIRQKLWHNIQLLKEKLIAQELSLFESESAIICLKAKNVEQALKTGELLYQNGFFCPAIRPPTVPTSRIRFSLMATHEDKHIFHLTKLLQNL